MKKRTFTLLLVIACYGASAHTVTILRCGGGAAGYRDVMESHSTETDALTCNEPGINGCKWTTPPSYPLVHQVENDVIQQIQAGNTRGTMDVIGGTVSWSGSSQECYTYTIQTSK